MSNVQLNTIYNEDCLETMRRMPDNFVDLVLTDPFMGSGATARACQNLNRNFILMEKEPEYVEIIKKRLAANKGER